MTIGIKRFNTPKASGGGESIQLVFTKMMDVAQAVPTTPPIEQVVIRIDIRSAHA
jgi:hypothetical protein